MDNIVKQMRPIWKMANIDWMGYERISKYDRFSFHHIIRKSDGGTHEINNGAVLIARKSHEYIHLIEYKDLDMYIYLNKMLSQINSQREMPTKQQFTDIHNVLCQFEREHCSDVNNDGIPLIKKRYLSRILSNEERN